jgi:hypothetical protein
VNLIGTKLNSLNRRLKTILVLFNDLFLAFTCWLVFGPPMATIISGQNKNNLFEVIYSQIYSFIFPAILFLFTFISLDITDPLFVSLIQETQFCFVFPALCYLDFHGQQSTFFNLILFKQIFYP